MVFVVEVLVLFLNVCVVCCWRSVEVFFISEEEMFSGAFSGDLNIDSVTGCRGNHAKFYVSTDGFLLRRENSVGNLIKLFGIIFGGQLLMTSAIRVCFDEQSWRFRTLMRTHRYDIDA